METSRKLADLMMYDINNLKYDNREPIMVKRMVILRK